MRFLFLSKYGDGLGIALRLQAEGHEVCFRVSDGVGKRNGEGFFPDNNLNTNCVIFDMSGDGWLADIMRWDGHKVIGSSSLMDRLEQDRNFAFEVMEKYGINTPQHQTFTDWESARQFASSVGERLVFKPSGSLSDHCSSFVSHDSDELISMLENLQRSFSSHPEFELQEFVEGIDISTEGWFNGENFIQPFNHTLETKKFMDGDEGMSEGCTGNIVWATEWSDPLVQETLIKLTPFLREHKYIGPIDVNVILNDEGIYALEFTPRFGYDATPTLFLELFDGDVGSFLYNLPNDIDSMPLRNGISAGLRLSVPPWPNEEHESVGGVVIEGIKNFDHFSPHDVCYDEGKGIVTSGAWGIIGTLTGYGNTIEEAFSTPYKMANKIRLPQKQFRSDLVEYFEKRFRKINRILGEAAA